MIQQGKYDIHALWCKVCVPLLAFSWCAGLLLGTRTAVWCGDVLSGLVRNAARSVPSFLGSATTALLSFFISALAVSYHRPMLLSIAFVKAFCFGFCGYGVGLSFGQGSWLVLPLFLFSDCCITPVLYLYWVRNISPDPKWSWRDLWICVIYASCVGCIDHWFVSPFLASVIR